jgi:ribonuclease HII
MALLVGIDEVGYGPKLGPLVVCAFAFRVPDPEVDLWKALGPTVGRTKGIVVADSKVVYSPSRGIGTLEATALPFLSLLPSADVGSLRAVAKRVVLGGESALDAPWYGDVTLPIESEKTLVDERAVALWNAARRGGVVPFGCWAAWAEPAAFNRAVASTMNKSDFLFDRACALMKQALAAAPGETAWFFVGKQGGRRFYLPGLVREFGSVWVLEEQRGTSRYEFQEKGRSVRVSFLVDGEDRHFGIALASIVGKYLRECAMRRFNEWWAQRMPGLRPTAGYGTDGTRFYREVEPAMEGLNLRREQVLRSR